MFIMNAHDPELALPDPFLLRTHSRLAASLHLFHVEERVAEGWPSPRLFYLGNKALRALRPLWHFVPKVIRSQCYSVLLKLGSYLYPRSSTPFAHRLPFGLYAKNCHRSPRNEGETLRLLEQYNSIPSPLWVDEYQGTERMLIMTAMPGQPLDQVFHRLSYPERKQLAQDLRSVVLQLRSIPNRTSHVFANTYGGPLKNHRFPSGTCGPFNDISEFNDFLVHRAVQNETREKISAVHARQYRSCFTHADLYPTNILIDRGRLSGIIDWECAGFYPEYWEFTKLIYGTDILRAFEPIIRDAFAGVDYEEELAAETLLWYDTPFGV
ncbi:unnamed protein product [Penicillium olsonii]|nr:unnamed protein product [Penicillium olsonii]